MLRGLSLTCSPVLTDCCASCINNDESDEGQAGSAWQTDVSLTPELECPIKFQVKRQLGRFSFFLMMTSVTRRLDACRWWRLAFLCWYPHLNARLLFLYILLFMTFIVYDTSLSCPPHLSPPPTYWQITGTVLFTSQIIADTCVHTTRCHTQTGKPKHVIFRMNFYSLFKCGTIQNSFILLAAG